MLALNQAGYIPWGLIYSLSVCMKCCFPTQCLLLMFMLAGAGQYLWLCGEIPLAEAEGGTWL